VFDNIQHREFWFSRGERSVGLKFSAGSHGAGDVEHATYIEWGALSDVIRARTFWFQRWGEGYEDSVIVGGCAEGDCKDVGHGNAGQSRGAGKGLKKTTQLLYLYIFEVSVEG
jgi:hypothetical protein